MGFMDRFKSAPEEGDGRVEENRPTQKRELTPEEREQLIEDARSELPELDKTVEQNLSRLRDLSKKS